MATFQINQDHHEKENPNIPNFKEKSALHGGAAGGKKPLAVIGGNEKALHPRANLAVLSHNNHDNVPHGGGIPVPSGKVAFRDIGNLRPDENAAAAFGAKKSNVVPVEQFKTFSVYEDNIDTRPQILVEKTLTTVANQENISCEAAKFNLMHKEYPVENEYDLDTTPMSVIDVLSPMSVDRSLTETSSGQLADGNLSNAVNNASAIVEKELIPRNDRNRFFEVVQYQHDILENFRESEKKHRPKPQYMRRQTDINHSMRTILVDWLVEVAEEYKMDTETLYLAVSYLDRFLSQMSVKRAKLQLVGTAAMYIASKYEEIYPPDVGDFVFLTDDSYTKSQVLRMEQVFLKILSFNLCSTTPYVYINTYAVMCDMHQKLKNLSLFICELSLMEGESYLQYLPSVISSASVALARHILGMPMWTMQLEEITTYSLDKLKDVVLLLCKTHKVSKDLNTQAIREKYKREKYSKVTLIECIELSEEEMNGIVQIYEAANRVTIDPLSALNASSKVNLFYKF